MLLVLLIALRLGGYRFSGQVRRLIAAYPEAAGDSGNPGLAHGVPLVSGSSSFRKRFRLNRKPLHTLWGYRLILVHVYGRGCVRWVILISLCLITLGGDVIMLFGTLFMSMTELGWDDFPGIVQAHVSRFARLFN